MNQSKKIELLQTFFERQFFIENKLKDLNQKLSKDGLEYVSEGLSEDEAREAYQLRATLKTELFRLKKYIKLVVGD